MPSGVLLIGIRSDGVQVPIRVDNTGMLIVSQTTGKTDVSSLAQESSQQDILAAIQALDLHVDAPTITVNPTPVRVDAPVVNVNPTPVTVTGPTVNVSPPAVTVNVDTVKLDVAATSAFLLNTLASTNAQVIKASAASLFELDYYNPTAFSQYLKLYNMKTVPNPATDIPVLTLELVGAKPLVIPMGTYGKRFPVGLAMAITTGIIDNNTTAVPAGTRIGMTYI